MATWQDVRRCATALPEVVEGTSYGRPAWAVRKSRLVTAFLAR